MAPLPNSPPGPLTSKGAYMGNGQALVVNQYLQSPAQRYFAIMQTDGNLCVYRGTPQATGPGGALWCHNKTWTRGPFVTVMQTDGNLCTYYGTPASYQANLWCSQRVAQGASYVAMQDDGNLCVYKGTPGQSGGAVWCHNTNVPLPPPPPPPPTPALAPSGPAYLAMGQSLTTNQFLQSANNRYYAIVQTDGNLCVYRGTPQATGAGGAIWCLQRTAAGGQFVLAMQSDGNLCEYVGTRSGYSGNLWCSNTRGQNFLVQQNDGNLCVYRGASPANQGAALWCHNTNVGR